jgi:hypothetical protein
MPTTADNGLWHLIPSGNTGLENRGKVRKGNTQRCPHYPCCWQWVWVQNYNLATPIQSKDQSTTKKGRSALPYCCWRWAMDPTIILATPILRIRTLSTMEKGRGAQRCPSYPCCCWQWALGPTITLATLIPSIYDGKMQRRTKVSLILTAENELWALQQSSGNTDPEYKEPKYDGKMQRRTKMSLLSLLLMTMSCGPYNHLATLILSMDLSTREKCRDAQRCPSYPCFCWQWAVTLNTIALFGFGG